MMLEIESDSKVKVDEKQKKIKIDKRQELNIL